MPKELTTAPDPAAVPADLANYLRADAIVRAINANAPEGLGLAPIPTDYVFKRRDKEVVAISLHAAFELVGGIPFLVAFAKTNPKEFLALWSKLLNDDNLQSGGTTINFVSQVPQSPLDLVNINSNGKVYTVEGFVEDNGELPE